VEGGVVPNPEHRVVQDDIPHGLCVLKDIAEHLRQRTPWIDLMIEWHQGLMGKEYLVNGRLRGKDIGETSALSVLGGTTLSNIGFVESPVIPCKL
jgi:opine dehydrogenase